MTIDVIGIERERTYPPRVTRFTEPFWTGLETGVFQTTRCRTCKRLSFPPKPICPHCWTEDVTWETLPEGGELYSWTRIHAGPAIFEPELPYEVGVIDLDAGIRVACRLFASELVEWRCGMRVSMITLAYKDGPLFAATPASS